MLLTLPITLSAEEFMTQGDALYDKGRLNYESYKQSGDIFVKAFEANPSGYEAAWKTARSYRRYADQSERKNAPNWKAICKEYGKLAMNYGEKAIALNPNGVEGYYWHGVSVGNYTEAVDVFNALTEDLKDKTQRSLEKAYQLNKMYDDGGPMIALGRFWYVVPWPMQDKKRSLKYLREYQKSFPDNARGQIYLAETLIADGEKDEAKALLQKTSRSSEKFYAEWAKRLLAEM
jgi:tetratricopeptide (TPR) repeat protein